MQMKIVSRERRTQSIPALSGHVGFDIGSRGRRARTKCNKQGKAEKQDSSKG
jgi:hypothetical protein